ncbi:MAG: hypothetical protein ACFFCM_18225, partial [Promethearchaeota archaeon]
MGNNNQTEILYFKCKEEDGQDFINFLKVKFKNLQLINPKFKILHEHDNILFPIIDNQVLINKVTSLVDKEINFEIISKGAIPNKNYKFRTLQEALEGKIPNKFSELIPKSYDIVGHIAIIEFDEFN